MRMMRFFQRLIFNTFSPELKKFLHARLERIPATQLLLDWYHSRTLPVYLISFPKTGRTWLSLMIGEVFELYFGLENTNILDLESLAKRKLGIPRIILTHDDAPHWKRPDELEESKNSYSHNKVIFLVRDPRDVIISLYFEKKKRLFSYLGREKRLYEAYFEDERIRPYQHNLSNYLSEEEGSFDTLLKYYNIFAKNRHVPRKFLLVKAR